MNGYDVFISFKHHDRNNNITADYVMAQELAKAFTQMGIRAFFSKTSLFETGASNYKREIDAALDEAKVLIVVGTSLEHINSDWVRYEWDGFANDIISGVKPDGRLFFLVDGVATHELPRTLRQVQGFSYQEDGVKELAAHVGRFLGIDPTAPEPEKAVFNGASTYSYTDTGEKQRLEFQAVLECAKDRGILEGLIRQTGKEKVNVLDVGCSAGFVTHKVFSGIEGIGTLVGLDKFEKCVTDFETEKKDSRFRAVQMNVEDADFPEKFEAYLAENRLPKFDIVYSALCMHHLSSTKNALKKLRRFMNKGAYIYIRTCDDGQDIAYPDEKDLVRQLITRTAQISGVSDRFHGRKLMEDLRRSGFSDIHTVNYCLDTVDKDADGRYFMFCNSFLWRKNYFKRQLAHTANLEKAMQDYAWVSSALEELEEMFYEPNFYYCYNIPIFIARL